MSDQTIPESFIDQTKQALEHLYDFPFLNHHPFSQAYGNVDEPSGHLVRRELMSAIESLNPGKNVAVRSNPARLYNLMHLHYIGGMTIQEAAYELGISLRQAYRDLRRGQESVSELLWFKYQSAFLEPSTDPSHASPQEAIPADTLSSLESEVARLDEDLEAVDILKLLDAALKAVSRLAESYSRRLHTQIPEQEMVASTYITIAQQVFVNLLSQSIQQANSEDIDIILSDHDSRAQLTVRYQTAQDGDPIKPMIAQLLQQLRWNVSIQREGESCTVTLVTTGTRSTVLIIDDNEGLVDLMKRYFSGKTYQVLTAYNGADGLRLALQAQPDAIIMDLMMPGMDGWELLQHLRTQPETKQTPVIICSVINDPELAYSLGASRFIAKPVNKEMIFSALRELKL